MRTEVNGVASSAVAGGAALDSLCKDLAAALENFPGGHLTPGEG